MGKTYKDRCYKSYSEYQRMPNSARRRRRKRKELEVIQSVQAEELMERITFKFNGLAFIGIGFVSTLPLPIATKIILSILLLGTGCSIFVNTEGK